MRIKLKGSIIIEICREPSKKSHNIIVPDQAKSNPRRELVFTQKAIYTTYHAMGTPYRCTQKAIYTTDHAIRYTLKPHTHGPSLAQSSKCLQVHHSYVSNNSTVSQAVDLGPLGIDYIYYQQSQQLYKDKCKDSCRYQLLIFFKREDVFAIVW